MKKLILITMAVMLASMAGASGWDNWSGSSTNPIINGYYTSIYGVNILPLVANTGSVGSAGNAWDKVVADTVNALVRYQATTIDTGLTITMPNATGLNKNGRIAVWGGNAPGLYSTDTSSAAARRGISFNYSYATDSWRSSRGLTAGLDISTTENIYSSNGNIYTTKSAGKVYADTVKFTRGLISDSTAYVLKRIFMRNDSLFFVVNTDTFRVVKK